MENQTLQNQQPFGFQISIPNSTAVLVLGIISIALCWCYGIIGLACGIVALILAGKAKTIYEAEPENYTMSSFNNLKAGRICAIIGICLSSIYVVVIIIYVAFIGVALSTMPWGQF